MNLSKVSSPMEYVHIGQRDYPSNCETCQVSFINNDAKKKKKKKKIGHES